MTKDETKQEQARSLRYKRPALALMGWETITSELSEIQSACDDVSYSMSADSILDAFDGDEERAWEFQMAFADLSAKCEQLSNCLYDHDELSEYFDDCTVALIGNRYKSIGYDDYEEDYYQLTNYEEELAQSEAGKRVCRWTKKDMLTNIGQCMGPSLLYTLATETKPPEHQLRRRLRPRPAHQPRVPDRADLRRAVPLPPLGR